MKQKIIWFCYKTTSGYSNSYQWGDSTFITEIIFPDVFNQGGEVNDPAIMKYPNKKLLRNFEGQIGSMFKKLWGLNAEVVSYNKKSVL